MITRLTKTMLPSIAFFLGVFVFPLASWAAKGTITLENKSATDFTLISYHSLGTYGYPLNPSPSFHGSQLSAGDKKVVEVNLEKGGNAYQKALTINIYIAGSFIKIAALQLVPDDNGIRLNQSKSNGNYLLEEVRYIKANSPLSDYEKTRFHLIIKDTIAQAPIDFTSPYSP